MLSFGLTKRAALMAIYFAILFLSWYDDASLPLVSAAADAGPSSSALHAAHRTFADALTSDLYSYRNHTTNDCTSAFCLSLGLSLLYPACRDEAALQMQQVLGFPETSRSSLAWNDTARRLDTTYDGQCYNPGCLDYEPTLQIASRIWVDPYFGALNPDFASVVGDYVALLNFQDSSAGQVINLWVNASTNGVIESIVENGPLATNTMLLALTSLYLKARWELPFQAAMTNQDVFYHYPTDLSTTGSTSSSSTTRSRLPVTTSFAHFMHQADYFPYSHTVLPGFQVLQLPFARGSLSLIVALPLLSHSRKTISPSMTIATPLPVTSSTELLSVLPLPKSEFVAVALPKFKYESDYNDALKQSLQTMGLASVFAPGQLCILGNDDCASFISEIRQKTVVAVEEGGMEAAVVTTIVVSRQAPQILDAVLFQADHIFQWFVYDSKEDLVVLEGRVGQPGIPEDDNPPLLQAQHQDRDFWTTNVGVRDEPIEPLLPSSNSSAQPTKTDASPTASPGQDPTSAPGPSADCTSPPPSREDMLVDDTPLSSASYEPKRHIAAAMCLVAAGFHMI